MKQRETVISEERGGTVMFRGPYRFTTNTYIMRIDLRLHGKRGNMSPALIAIIGAPVVPIAVIPSGRYALRRGITELRERMTRLDWVVQLSSRILVDRVRPAMAP